MMKPVDEHCLTQRLNFRFFRFRSSRSVHVAMNTGSSSIRGSCSTCREREGGESHGKQRALGDHQIWAQISPLSTAVWPWLRDFASLILSRLIYERVMSITLPSLGRIK